MLSGIVNNPITRLAGSIFIGIVLVTLIIYYLPIDDKAVEYPENIATAFEWFAGVLYQWDFIFPVQLFLWVVFFMVMLEVLLITIKIIIFLWRIFTKGS